MTGGDTALSGVMIVSLLASIGWLALNFRALQAQGLTFRQKAIMAGAWTVIFVVVAFAFDRLTG